MKTKDSGPCWRRGRVWVITGFVLVVLLLSLLVPSTCLAAWPDNGVAVCANPLQQRHPEITLWIYNYAQVPQQTVTKAKMEMAKILSQAGIMTEWIDCPISSSEAEENAACQQRMRSTELAIMILHKVKLPSGASRDTYLGTAEVLTNRRPGHYIYLSYDNIRDSFYSGGISSAEILAGVAVHEIGHALFRSIEHSPAGLMRAKWDRQDLQNIAMGRLFFTPQQAEILQAEVAARANEDGPNLAVSSSSPRQRSPRAATHSDGRP